MADTHLEGPSPDRELPSEDLVDREARKRRERRQALEAMVADADEADLYQKTDRLPPAMR